MNPKYLLVFCFLFFCSPSLAINCSEFLKPEGPIYRGGTPKQGAKIRGTAGPIGLFRFAKKLRSNEIDVAAEPFENLVAKHGEVSSVGFIPHSWRNVFFRWGQSSWPGAGIFRWIAGNSPELVFVTRPDLVMEIFSKPEVFIRPHDMFKTVLGDHSMFVQTGDTPSSLASWRQTHQSIIGHFAPRNIETTYSSALKERALKTVQDWIAQRKTVVDQQTDLFAIATIMENLFGASPNPSHLFPWQITQAYADLIFHSGLLPKEKATALREGKETREEMEAIDQTIVEELFQMKDRIERAVAKRPEKEQEKYRERIREVVSTRAALIWYAKNIVKSRRRDLNPPENLLHSLLKTQKENELPDNWVFDQMLTMIFAGQETTRSFLKFALFRLAEDPSLTQEIRDSQGEARTELIENFLKEVLRFHPQAPLIPRIVKAETGAPLGEFYLPKNTLVYTSPWISHRLERNWQEKDLREFRRCRFAGLGGLSLKGAFFPFGYGSRVCIGRTLAKMEAHALIEQVALHSNVSVAPGFKPDMIFNGATVHFANPLELVFEPYNAR